MNTTTFRKAPPAPSLTLPGPKMPFSVEASSTLLQDFIPAQSVEVGSTTNTVAFFTNPLTEAAEALAIVAGNLCWLQRNPGSQTGWDLQDLKLSATQVVTTVEPYTKTTFAFYTDQQQQLHCLALATAGSSLSWTNSSLNFPHDPLVCDTVKVAYSDAALRIPYVFAVDAGSNVLWVGFFNWGTGGWAPLHWTFLEATLTSGTLSNDFVVYSVTANPMQFGLYSLSGGQISIFVGLLTTALGMQPSLSLTYRSTFGTQVQKVVGVGPAGFLFLDQSGTLTSNTAIWGGVPPDSVPVLSPPPQKTFIDAAAVLDADMLWDVYLTDSSGTLWILQQTGWAPAQYQTTPAPVWMQATLEGSTTSSNVAIPFDSNVEACFVGSNPSDPPYVLCRYGGDQFPTYYQQDRHTGEWTRSTVRLPSTQPPIPATRYRTKVRLLDANRVPVSGQQAWLSAESPVEVEIAGKMDLLIPHEPVQVTTDIFGCLNLAIFADGLTPPGLTFDTEGLPSGAEVKPAAPVQDYLAGVGTLNLKEPLSGQQLEAAKVDGQSVFPQETWSKYKADLAVRDIQNVFAVAAGRPVPPQTLRNGVAAPLVGVIYQSYNPHQPAYHAYTSREEFEQDLTSIRTHAAYGGLLEDLEASWNNLWEGIKSGAAQLSMWAVDLLNRTIELAVNIGGQIYKLGKWIVDSIEEAADAVTAFFSYLGAKVNEVINWLKAAFNPKDLWDTKTALEGLILQSPGMGINLINEYGNKVVGNFFAGQIAQITGYLDQMKEVLPHTLQDFDEWESESNGKGIIRKALAARTAVIAQGSDGKVVTRGDVDTPEGSWFFDVVSTVASGVSGLALPPELQEAWNNLVMGLSTAEKSFQQALSDVSDLFLNLFAIDDPDTLALVETATLIDLVKQLVTTFLQLADTLVQTIFNVAKAALGAAGELLTSTTFTPDLITNLINSLHQLAYPGQPDPPVTFTSVVSLIFAIPATLAWKIMYGTDAALFPGGNISTSGSEHLGLSPTGGACSMAAAIVRMLPFNACDILSDLFSPNWTSETISEGAMQFVAPVQIACELLLPVILWPSPSGIPGTQPCQEGEQVEKIFRGIAWGVNWTYAAIDLASYMFSFAETTGKRVLVKNREDWCLYGISGLGFVELVSTIALAAVSQDPVSLKISDIAGSVSPFTQFLRTKPLVGATDEVSIPLKLGINLVSNLACGVFRIYGSGVVPTAIVAAGGTPQFAVVGTKFEEALEAKVSDPQGRPVQRTGVTFSAPSSDGAGGTFDNGTTTITVNTDDVEGVATAAFTANKGVGSDTVTATIAGSTGPNVPVANFALANVTQGTATDIEVDGGDGQSAKIGTAFAKPLQARVTDPEGNPSANAPVTFTAAQTGASGNFSPNGTTAKVQTNTDGVATAPLFTANITPGSYQVTTTITAPGNIERSASFNLTNIG